VTDGPATDDERLPLADVRVLELGQLLAGPFCGQLLGDFGRGRGQAGGPGGATRCGSGAGNVVPGPAIVTEMDSTTLVLPGHVASVHPSGSLLITPDGWEA
jgi:hypothetical protein